MDTFDRKLGEYSNLRIEGPQPGAYSGDGQRKSPPHPRFLWTRTFFGAGVGGRNRVKRNEMGKKYLFSKFLDYLYLGVGEVKKLRGSAFRCAFDLHIILVSDLSNTLFNPSFVKHHKYK